MSKTYSGIPYKLHAMNEKFEYWICPACGSLSVTPKGDTYSPNTVCFCKYPEAKIAMDRVRLYHWKHAKVRGKIR